GEAHAPMGHHPRMKMGRRRRIYSQPRVGSRGWAASGAASPCRSLTRVSRGTTHCRPPLGEHAQQNLCRGDTPPGRGRRRVMEVVYARCAGVDVHKKNVVVCRITPGADGKPVKEIRTFTTMTRDLLALSDWLQAGGVTHLAMESTGVIAQGAPGNRSTTCWRATS